MATGRVPTTANSPLTAKGDLFGYSTAPARLAVGNDGEQIVADSSTSTGLRYISNFAAGKNEIINGDFGVWQRGTSFTTDGAYTSDRWIVDSNATFTASQQTFTPGAAPVAGYESQFYLQIAKSAGGTYCDAKQRLEDVRTFAGQTITLSAYMRVSSGTASVEPYYNQVFGSGGSAAVNSTVTAQTITSSWARYSFTFAIPSVSGKTIGTSSYLELYLPRIVTASAVTVQIWGVQAEVGSVATAFQTATGTIQGELAACQRYLPAIAASNGEIYTGQCYSTTAALIPVVFPVTARVAPTGITVNSAGNFRLRNATATKVTTTAINFSTGTVQGSTIEGIVASGLVAGNATNLFNESSGTILFTGCEL